MKKISYIFYTTILFAYAPVWCVEQGRTAKHSFGVSLPQKKEPSEKKFKVHDDDHYFQLIPSSARLITRIDDSTYSIYTEDGTHVKNINNENLAYCDGSVSDDGKKFACTTFAPHGNPIYDLETTQVVETYGEGEERPPNGYRTGIYFGPEGTKEIWVGTMEWGENHGPTIFSYNRYDRRSGRKVGEIKNCGQYISPDRKTLARLDTFRDTTTRIILFDAQTQKEVASSDGLGNPFIYPSPQNNKQLLTVYWDNDPWPHKGSIAQVLSYDNEDHEAVAICGYETPGRSYIEASGYNHDGSAFILGYEKNEKHECVLVDSASGKALETIPTSGGYIENFDTREDGTLVVLSTLKEQAGLFEIFNLNEKD